MIKVLHESSIDRVRQHFENGDVIGIISAYRAKENLYPPHLYPDLKDDHNKHRVIHKRENQNKDAEMEAYLKSFARGLHLGYNKAIGHWIENRGKEDEQIVDEMSFIVYGKPEDKDDIYKLLMALCRRFDQEGFMLIYDKKAYEIKKNGEEKYSGTFNGSLKELGDQYTSLYRRERYFYSDSIRKNWSFVFESLIDYSPIRLVFNSYMDRKDYTVTRNLLERYGENAFEYVKLPKRNT